MAVIPSPIDKIVSRYRKSLANLRRRFEIAL